MLLAAFYVPHNIRGGGNFRRPQKDSLKDCLLLSLIQVDELHQVRVALLGGLFVLLEQDLGALGEFAGQPCITGLILQELLITAGGRLAVQREGVLALSREKDTIICSYLK